MKNSTAIMLLITILGCGDFIQQFKRHLSSQEELEQVDKLNFVAGLNESAVQEEDSLVSLAKVNKESRSLDEEESTIPYSRRRNELEMSGNYENAESEGSLWNSKGQSNFLFSRNSIKEVGDVIMVKLDRRLIGDLNKDIYRLLTKDKEKKKQKEELTRQRLLAAKKQKEKELEEERLKEADKGDLKKEGLRKQSKNEPDNLLFKKGDAGNKSSSSKEEMVDYFEDAHIVATIMKKIDNNSYHIAGVKTLFIEDKKYKMSFSGLITNDDISKDDIVSTTDVLNSSVNFSK